MANIHKKIVQEKLQEICCTKILQDYCFYGVYNITDFH
jgi:hypothetical protein